MPQTLGDDLDDLDPFSELVAELPLGVVQMSVTGEIETLNPNARLFLDGPVGGRVRAALSRLCAREAASTRCVEANLSMGAWGEVRVLVAKSRCKPGFVAVLERNVLARVRAEAAVLRSMLSAATSAASVKDAVGGALATLASLLDGSHLALFEIDASGTSLVCTANAAVPANYLKYLAPKPIDAKASMVSYTVATGRPMHVTSLAKSVLPALCPPEAAEALAALALPVRCRGRTVAALYICGPSSILGEGELRLVQGLADALGSLIEHARQEATILSERQALASLVDSLPDAIIELDSEGRISSAAGRVEPIIGQVPEELVGKPIDSLIVPEQRESFLGLWATASTAPNSGDFWVVRPDKKLMVCDVSVHVIGGAGKTSVTRAIFRDQSARRALEAEALRARDIATQRDRLATIGQLAAGVAHEINNPLAYLKSNLGSLKGHVEDLVAGAEGKENLGEMKDIIAESLDGVGRISTIVQALKGTARQRPNERIRFDPSRAVNEAVTIFRGAKKHACSIDFEPKLVPEVIGAPGGLGQVVLNLLQNALDAMGGKGTATLRVEAVGEKIEVTVADKGTGIPADVQPSLFEPFFTTKDPGQGTGLGLYICLEIVESMGGTITFETGETGTTFKVSLPMAPQND
jgi:PAS domain S-box-containing protein